MSISKILNSLEKSWERDDILLNIKKGLGTDEIVNEFLMKNERQIKELNSLLRPEHIELLNQLEKIKSYFETGKNVSDEVINLNKVKTKSSSKKILEKVKIKYFANRLIRKS